MLREWRQRRRMSQLDLATEAEISARHLSFVETGRAQPSREMLLHLAEQLGVPLRERNLLLVAAGFAPIFRERSLDDPALAAARRAMEQVLASHAPFPALAIDRHWNLLAANAMVLPLLASVPAALLRPPINVLRLSLQPDGLASQIVNLAEWRAHLLVRLGRQIDLTADPVLIALRNELRAYPGGAGPSGARPVERGASDVAIPFRLQHADAQLSFFTTTMMFGTPLDITVSELAIESFFPADAATAAAVQRMAAALAPETPPVTSF